MPEPSVFRPNGISYLRLPAPDPARSAAFYGEVFGWEVRTTDPSLRSRTAAGM